MSVFCLGSAKGAPGVTTTALVLAGVWSQDRKVILVEADPSGGTLASVYHLDASSGLLALASAGSPQSGELEDHVQTVPGGLGVLVAPSNPRSARPVIRDTAGVLVDWAAEPGHDLIVDCGRFEPDHPAGLLRRRADRVLLLVQPRVDQLLPAVSVASHVGRDASLLLVGDKPYRPEQVEDSFEVDVFGVVAWDPRTAAALSGQGGLSQSRLVRSRLLLSVVPVAQRLSNEMGAEGRVRDAGEVVGWTS